MRDYVSEVNGDLNFKKGSTDEKYFNTALEFYLASAALTQTINGEANNFEIYLK